MSWHWGGVNPAQLFPASCSRIGGLVDATLLSCGVSSETRLHRVYPTTLPEPIQQLTANNLQPVICNMQYASYLPIFTPPATIFPASYKYRMPPPPTTVLRRSRSQSRGFHNINAHPTAQLSLVRHRSPHPVPPRSFHRLLPPKRLCYRADEEMQEEGLLPQTQSAASRLICYAMLCRSEGDE
jgi:hypothetical protein